MPTVSREQLHNAIRSRYDQLVATPLALPTAYDNAKFDTPANQKWSRLTILTTETLHVEIGTDDRVRMIGVAIASLFAPIETGDGELLEIADAIDAAFRLASAGGVTYRTPYHTNVGAEASFYRMNVNCPFYADSIL